ncbi:MAG: hypothetical protein IJ106_04820 [Parasporobacterium sp.]|nr:hypothetical protein [Parasporobacterium sp.]
MSDNYRTNYNDYTEDPKIRQLDDIYADVDEAYDYRSSGTGNTAADSRRRSAYAASSGASRQRTSSYSRTGSSYRTAASSRTSSYSRTGGSSSRSGRTSSQTASASRTSSRAVPSESRQRPVSSAARAQRSLNRKRKKKFRRLFLMYITILILILIVGAILFSSYLSSFENGQPSHIAETIVKSYASQQGIVDFISSNAEKTSLSENLDLVAQTYATNIAGKKISYKENSDFRPDSPSYDITADGSIVAKVTLAPDGTGSFGSPKWKISTLNIADYLPDAMSVTIDAPAGSTVSVNGTVLGSNYIVSTGVPEILMNSLQFLAESPQYDTYKMSGLLSEPTVTVTDASGSSLNVAQTDNHYVASAPADQAFIDSVEPRVYEALENYATYFIHMSFNLSNYIVYGSDLYSYIFGSETMDPIATTLYMFEDIESYDFAERSATNYVKYADDCFTVDVKYALDMVFTDPTYEDNNQKMDATWVFVIEPLDGSWCISDIISH